MRLGYLQYEKFFLNSTHVPSFLKQKFKSIKIFMYIFLFEINSLIFPYYPSIVILLIFFNVYENLIQHFLIYQRNLSYLGYVHVMRFHLTLENFSSNFHGYSFFKNLREFRKRSNVIRKINELIWLGEEKKMVDSPNLTFG